MQLVTGRHVDDRRHYERRLIGGHFVDPRHDERRVIGWHVNDCRHVERRPCRRRPKAKTLETGQGEERQRRHSAVDEAEVLTAIEKNANV